MKILKIFRPELSHEDDIIVTSLLNRGIFNDYLFEKIVFTVDAIIDTDLDIFYRRMWEDLYLKVLDNKITYTDSRIRKIKFHPSLSEAINFIHTATPPKLKDKIPDSITSLTDITKVLQQFLMNDSNGVYSSIFRKVCRLEPFETKWPYDNTNIDTLSYNNDINIVGQIICSDRPYSYFVDKNKSTHNRAKLQMLFLVKGNEHLSALYNIIDDNKFVIIGINNDYKNKYIMAYTDQYQLTTNDGKLDNLGQMIESSYKNIFN